MPGAALKGALRHKIVHFWLRGGFFTYWVLKSEAAEAERQALIETITK